jgi:hypothetical protein
MTSGTKNKRSSLFEHSQTAFINEDIESKFSATKPKKNKKVPDEIDHKTVKNYFESLGPNMSQNKILKENLEVIG